MKAFWTGDLMTRIKKMAWRTWAAVCVNILFMGIFLVGCDSEGANQTSNTNQYSKQDIENAESCWLETYGFSLDDRVGDGECKALANRLTDVPGYGTGKGGFDYVQQQKAAGDPLPLLVDVKNEVEACDVLILAYGDYLPVGHTVVVFYNDLANDTIYYLEQNNPLGKGIAANSLKIGENEAYVIFSECNKPINCPIAGIDGPIIAAPQSTAGEISGDATAATLEPEEQKEQKPEEARPNNPLDVYNADSVIEWLSYALIYNDLSVFEQIMQAKGLLYGSGMSGGRNETSKQEFLDMLEIRLESGASCIGYDYFENDSIHIWTDGWQPEWELGPVGHTENAFSDELYFSIHYKNNGWRIVGAFASPSAAALDSSPNSHPCPLTAGDPERDTFDTEDQERHKSVSREPKEPLDIYSLESTLDWFFYGLENQDVSTFSPMVRDVGPFYTDNPIEGGQENTRQEFLADLEERLPSQPRCEIISSIPNINYQETGDRFMIWTTMWSPKWELTEYCYGICTPLDDPRFNNDVGFSFKLYDDGWKIKSIYFGDRDVSIDFWKHAVFPCADFPQ